MCEIKEFQKESFDYFFCSSEYLKPLTEAIFTQRGIHEN